jgi:hypothetical protein
MAEILALACSGGTPQPKGENGAAMTLSAIRQTIAQLAQTGNREVATQAREEGFYWVILGQNPPEIAYWERGEWWLAGDARPWQLDAVFVASERLVFRPRLMPVA